MTEDQPVQETPAGHIIPVPKAGDVFRDLRKAAKAPEPTSDARPDGSGPEDEQ